jgi:hypothetical protein
MPRHKHQPRTGPYKGIRFGPVQPCTGRYRIMSATTTDIDVVYAKGPAISMAAVNAEASAGTLTLDRPTGIEDPSWAAITGTIERLGRATSAGDLSQAVGVAKELVESVARSVLVVRGEVVAENATFTGVVARAHEVLERQPGKGLTQAEPLRSVMQNAKAMACKLGDLRNSFGTGHGRAVEPPVTDEVSQVCTDAALMWSRWALRRLNALAQGMPTPLINDLLDGAIFRSGLLTERLASADLVYQEPEVQRWIGVAVGQRAMRETFVVRRDGIEECAVTRPRYGPPPTGKVPSRACS